jgi:Flp pilus assembly protein TadD
MADKATTVELTPLEAIEQYERAVHSEPQNADKLMELGAAYYIAHRWDEALRTFEETVAVNPGLAHAHYYLGVLYGAKGDKARAEKELNLVVSTSKNPILVAQARARIPSVTSPAQLAANNQSR